MPTQSKMKSRYDAIRTDFDALLLLDINQFYTSDTSRELLEAIEKVNAAFENTRKVINQKHSENLSEDDMRTLRYAMENTMRPYNTFRKLLDPDYKESSDDPYSYIENYPNSLQRPYKTMNEALLSLNSASQHTYGSTKYRRIGVAMRGLSTALAIASGLLIGLAINTLLGGLLCVPSIPVALIVSASLFVAALSLEILGKILPKICLSEVGRSMADLNEALAPFKDEKTLQHPKTLLSFFKRPLPASTPAPVIDIVKLRPLSQAS